MRTLLPWSSGSRCIFAGFALLTVVFAPVARATVFTYTATLDGPSESPPNASPGTGSALVVIDDVANTMHVHVDFSGLLGTTTASHIHASTAVAGVGTAGVATTTPTFPGFPLGVTAGTYDVVLNLALASSYNASYVTANGGTPASAETALLAGIAAGKAYLNVHTTVVTGGEIRGFLVPGSATPAARDSWGSVKSHYR
jgi:hypothetical protein